MDIWWFILVFCVYFKQLCNGNLNYVLQIEHTCVNGTQMKTKYYQNLRRPTCASCHNTRTFPRMITILASHIRQIFAYLCNLYRCNTPLQLGFSFIIRMRYFGIGLCNCKSFILTDAYIPMCESTTIHLPLPLLIDIWNSQVFCFTNSATVKILFHVHWQMYVHGFFRCCCCCRVYTQNYWIIG